MKTMHRPSPNLLVNHTLVQKFNSNDSSADSRAFYSVRLFLNHGVLDALHTLDDLNNSYALQFYILYMLHIL